MTGWLNTATSFAATIVRLGFGTVHAPECRAAPHRLILYDFEACPFCRKVREALSHLGLEVEVRPTARGSLRREELRYLVQFQDTFWGITSGLCGAQPK